MEFLDVKEILKKYKIKLRKWYGRKKTINEVLNELSVRWVSLNESSKQEISRSFAGLRKGKNRVFKNVMDNMVNK